MGHSFVGSGGILYYNGGLQIIVGDGVHACTKFGSIGKSGEGSILHWLQVDLDLNSSERALVALQNNHHGLPRLMRSCLRMRCSYVGFQV